MKLLITTQKVDRDDDLLGFFHSWIAEFARHYAKVTVICLEKGEYDLPENVEVLSLGKEAMSSRANESERGPIARGYGVNDPVKIAPVPGLLRRLTPRNDSFLFVKFKYITRFYKYIWKNRNEYDRVFVHMNPEYLLLGGLLWRSWGKKTGLWYTHKSVTIRLRLAHALVNVVFTASRESFRLKSKKVSIVGHGIDTGRFSSLKKEREREEWEVRGETGEFRIVTIGRISPIKDYETLINAVEILVRPWRSHQGEFGNMGSGETLEVSPSIKVEIVGGAPMKEQEEYLEKLKRMVEEKNLGEVIQFTGPVPNTKIVQHLQAADLFVHTSRTGSLDKAILEAMAAGLPVISCNDSSRELLTYYKDSLLFKERDPQDLAKKIDKIINIDPKEREKIGINLQNKAQAEHGIEKLIGNISSELIC